MKRMRLLLSAASLAALVMAALAGLSMARADEATVCRVDLDAVGPTHDGTSWGSAYLDLNTALGDPACNEIWVATGLYVPGPTQTDTFTIKPGVAVYGGFNGTETDRSQRNWTTQVTVLSGDIYEDDLNRDSNGVTPDHSDIVGFNIHTVVYIDGFSSGPATSTTVLDGFTITAGDNIGGFGGGVRCRGSGATHGCSPTLANLIVIGNQATWGGGLANHGDSSGVSSPSLTNISFHGNNAVNQGGALYNDGDGSGNSSPVLTHVTFSDNSAAAGGAMLDWAGHSGMANPVLTDVTFSGNSAEMGGAIYNQAQSGGTASPSLANVTFSGNSATNGSGGAFENAVTGTSTTGVPVFRNVTFNGNTASQNGGAIINECDAASSCSPMLTNVVLWGDSADLSDNEYKNSGGSPHFNYSVIQGGCASIASASCGSGNLATDPKLGPLGSYGGYTQTRPLLAGSSAINTGDDATCTAAPVSSIDQRGVARPQSYHCDIGAYEVDQDTVDVIVAGALSGMYVAAPHAAEQHSYAGTNNGPALVGNATLGSVLSSIRVLYAGGSYSEMMGYPNNTTSDFWFPWYNNVAMDSQFRVSNLGSTGTTITVYLGGSQIDSFGLAAGMAIRKNYGGQNNGPMRVTSSGGIPILATIRVVYGGTSFTEMMGYPNNATTQFWFPYYNNAAMSSQLRVSNLGIMPTTITVYLGASQIDSFVLQGATATRVSYAGQNSGPLRVVSSAQPILATIRVLYGASSYSEMMGFPNNATNEFWYPWYDDTGADSQLRVSNLGGSSTTITVYLAGSPIDSYTLGAGAADRRSYPGLNGGPLHIMSSSAVILSTVRILYGGTSFYELMGFPNNQLTSAQYFPWYNNTAMSSQLRFAIP